jgi:hypothetical protein
VSRRLDYFNRILRSLKYSMKDCFEDTVLAGAGDGGAGAAGDEDDDAGGDDDDESTVLGDVDVDGMTVRACFGCARRLRLSLFLWLHSCIRSH